MMSRAVAGLAWLGAALSAFALGPHEIALLVNRNSPDSIRLANEYAQMRKVPGANIVHLDLPDSARWTPAEMSPEDFNRLIWKPASELLIQRGVTDHILAWIYSADFPVRILTDPPMSLHGITFTRGVVPPADDIRKGMFRSPLFAGPDREDSPMGASLSLEQFAVRLTEDMPLPAMSLAVTGTRALTVDQALACLKYGVISDASAPKGRFHLVKSADVRGEARAWQFPIAEAELRKAGADVRIEEAPPSGSEIVGIMMGLSDVHPPAYGAYLPGALGDHLTSFGAMFETDQQTKLTAWLQAGATAAAGTVTEPFAIWTKFPNARLFAHYFGGVTVLEAYYAAVRCPLQLFMAGDPLARPWARPQLVTLAQLADDVNAITGKAEFVVTTLDPLAQRAGNYLFLLDGRTVTHPGHKPDIMLDTAALSDGYHELRAVHYVGLAVRHQSFSTLGFTVKNQGRGIRIASPAAKAEVDASKPLEVRVDVQGEPTELMLLAQERTLTTVPYATNAVLTLDPRHVGEGPLSIQAAARFSDGTVRGKPVPVTVTRATSTAAGK
jgi:uncharacterized protein (TIGR03790 family)